MQIHFRLENAEDTEHPSDSTFFFLVITVLLLLLFHSLIEWTLIVPPNLPESKGGTQESCKNEPQSPPIGNILELIWSMFRECLFLPRRASCVQPRFWVTLFSALENDDDFMVFMEFMV